MSNTPPLSWKVSSFDQVFSEIKNGCSIDQNTSGDGIPVTRIETISQEKIDYSKVGWVKTTDDIDRFQIEKHDILLSHINSLKHIGKTAIKEDDRRLYHGMNLLRLKVCKSSFYPVYIHNLLSWEVVREEMRRKAKQAINQASLNVQDIKSLTYALPPLPEQQKIATILSSVDDVIEKTRAQIDKLKDLKTGMMQELLTKGIGHAEFKSSDVGQIPKSWACELVSSLFEIQLGKMLSQAAKVGASPMPYLGNKDVQWGKINVTDLQTMDFSEREREKFLLKPRDLLMCEGGEVGRSAIWEGELKECYYQKAIHRLRPIDDAYEPRLLLEYMRYAKGQNLLADFISQTSIAHLTREKLSAIPIPVPPVAEQKKIVDIITSIDTRINRHLDKLKNTYDIKKALMQDLLTGKVRVNLNESAAL